jgi:ATP/maltotriose-dependent transcriptional regulator MalT
MAAKAAVQAAHRGGEPWWPGAQLGLSRRESEVLGLLVSGMSNRAIAAELVVGEETVKTHLRSIYHKLGVNDRAQAVATALRQGVFT